MKKIFYPSLIGIDIDHDSVRVVELSGNAGAIKVTHVDSEPLPPDTGDTINVVAQAIKTMLRRSSINVKNVASNMSGNYISKVILVPDHMDTEAINDHIRYGGAQYIPYPMDQVNFDFFIIGPSESQKEMLKVFLIANRKEHVDDVAALIENSGLKLKIIEPRQFSLFNLYSWITGAQEIKKRNIIIVEFGMTSTTLHAFENGIQIYDKEHKFGLTKLIDTIAKTFSLSQQDALRMYRYGGLPSSYEKSVLEPFVAEAGKEIVRDIEFFQSNIQNFSIDRVVLFGVGADLPKLSEFIPGYTVDIPRPFDGMTVGQKVNQRFLKNESSSMAVACGLALRRYLS